MKKYLLPLFLFSVLTSFFQSYKEIHQKAIFVDANNVLDSSYEKHLEEFIKNHQEEIKTLTAQGIQKDYAATMIIEKYPDELKAFQPNIKALLDHIVYLV
jgi:hypothetical protein